MKKIIICLFTGALLVTPMSVKAANTSDTALPSKWIAYPPSTAATTQYREKQDATSHYIRNDTNMHLYVKSFNGNTNLTVRNSATVGSGEWLIKNWVNEKGYGSCYLHITTVYNWEKGTLRGVWSPDSYGHYPSGN